MTRCVLLGTAVSFAGNPQRRSVTIGPHSPRLSNTPACIEHERAISFRADINRFISTRTQADRFSSSPAVNIAAKGLLTFFLSTSFRERGSYMQ